MYTIYTSTGEVYRNSDNLLIAPCSSVDDLNYVEYINWINQGNNPVAGVISPSETLACQSTAWELIKAERDRRKTLGGYKVGTNWYHSDDTSRIQQLALVMLGANIPANLYWKTMASNFVIMTQTLAMQVFQAALASDMTIFAIAEAKKTAMLASADPRTYDYLTGWPLIYGE